MSLFGGTSKTYYTTSTLPLYDENTTGLLKQSLVGSQIANTNLATTLVGDILNSNVSRLNGLYRYGKSGKYQWGLPDQVERYLSAKDHENIEMVISSEIGEPVIVAYATYDYIINPNLEEGKEWTLPNTPHIENRPPSRRVYGNELKSEGEDWYYVAEYTTKAKPNKYYQWWFKESTASVELYPFLQQENLTDNPYYPIIPYLVDKERWDNNPLYETNIRRASHFLGLNSSTVGRYIQDMSDENITDGDHNPIEDAYIFTGVPLNTKSDVGKEYLFRFFKMLYKSSKHTEGDYLNWVHKRDVDANAGLPPRNSISLSDVNFQNILSWSYIKKTIKTGVLTENGVKLKARKYSVELVEDSVLNFVTGPFASEYISGSTVFYRRQNANGTYLEIEVMGLGFSSLCVGREQYYTIEEAFEDVDEDAEKIVAPLHRTIMKQMGNIKGHDLLNIAIRMQVNDKVKIKRKASWFSIIIQVVALVVSVLYPPAGMALTIAARIAINIAIMIVMQALTPVITKTLQDVFGEEFGALLAVIVIFFLNRGINSITSAGSEAAKTATTVADASEVADAATTASITLTTMQQVNLGLAVTNAAVKINFNSEMENLTKEFDALEEEYKELSEISDLLSYDDISSLVVTSQLEDSNQILDTNQYVANTLKEVSRDSLITESTHEYTEAMRYTGRVYSPINNARILA